MRIFAILPTWMFQIEFAIICVFALALRLHLLCFFSCKILATVAQILHKCVIRHVLLANACFIGDFYGKKGAAMKAFLVQTGFGSTIFEIELDHRLNCFSLSFLYVILQKSVLEEFAAQRQVWFDDSYHVI